MTIDTDDEVTKVDTCNVIPAMKAGRIDDLADIAEGNWAPVNAARISSKTDENTHLLGEACSQSDMLKSDSSANSQAKVCANAVRGVLTESAVFPARFESTIFAFCSAELSREVMKINPKNYATCSPKP
jgi:sulfide dehydrogenase [flavocytochrome c] flavoprotein subunit